LGRPAAGNPETGTVAIASWVRDDFGVMKLPAFPIKCFCLLATVCFGRAASLPVDAEAVAANFRGKHAVLVVADTLTGETYVSDPALAGEAFGPGSTFKIWNTLIGFEEGILKSPDEAFWKWDGEKRSFPDWNRDLTLRQAFRASCVPAFQELAGKIGPERMQAWLDKLGYGNRDMCGRPDSFWLPRAGMENIMITPAQQAELLGKLVTGKLPVKKETVDALLGIMRIESSARATLFGKTGSGLRGAKEGPSTDNDFDMGWLVGVLDSGGHKYAYACLVLGPGLGGKEARGAVENIFRKSGLF
jgi:beta-lactamase class D